PTIGFNKQNVAFIEERIIDEQNRTELQEIYNMFANEGAHLMEITADKHDRAMALVQGLSHVQNLLFTNRIEESEFSIEELGTLSTPVYNMKLDSALRMLAGDPRLPALIQVHNPYCKHLISDIIEIYHMIEKYIENKDVDGLTEFVSDLKEYVGKYAEDASQRTDKLIGEPRFVTEIYFERHDTDIMSKIYKGTRNQKELDATLYQSSFERNGKEAIPIEEKDIMKATIFTGDAGKFTRSDKITAAREKYWTNYPYSKNGASVFYINNIENPGKYNNIVMTPINPKNPEATEKRHKRTRVKMNNNFTDPILNFFDTIRKNHIFEKTELPFVAIRSPHKIKRNND
ncbi:MAG: prephenate dehydrogenase/arogenate dehydrogenase family protein, partial [Candidatus Aenigmarchaeota archaeon]|nr:prephenate dehydrogenase/arogenate dehydrogenase family protein [Candidatus Aenigmarchaeota archaeon]